MCCASDDDDPSTLSPASSCLLRTIHMQPLPPSTHVTTHATSTTRHTGTGMMSQAGSAHGYNLRKQAPKGAVASPSARPRRARLALPRHQAHSVFAMTPFRSESSRSLPPVPRTRVGQYAWICTSAPGAGVHFISRSSNYNKSSKRTNT